jgi:hypothetical protein
MRRKRYKAGFRPLIMAKKSSPITFNRNMFIPASASDMEMLLAEGDRVDGVPDGATICIVGSVIFGDYVISAAIVNAHVPLFMGRCCAKGVERAKAYCEWLPAELIYRTPLADYCVSLLSRPFVGKAWQPKGKPLLIQAI